MRISSPARTGFVNCTNKRRHRSSIHWYLGAVHVSSCCKSLPFISARVAPWLQYAPGQAPAGTCSCCILFGWASSAPNSYYSPSSRRQSTSAVCEIRWNPPSLQCLYRCFHSRGVRYFPPYGMHRFLGRLFFATSPIPFFESLMTSSNSFQIIPLRLALGISQYVKGSRLTVIHRFVFAFRQALRY